MRPMTVLMPFYTPFYAPLVAGVALGHFREEGLDVRWQTAAAFGKSTVQALLDGSVEITLGGLMRRRGACQIARPTPSFRSLLAESRAISLRLERSQKWG